MDLKDFVQTTMQQIRQGMRTDSYGSAYIVDDFAHDASEQLRQTRDLLGQHGIIVLAQETIALVNFDVAVTVSDETEAAGRAGLLVAGIGVGARGKLQETNQTVSRIKFSLPLSLDPRSPRERIQQRAHQSETGEG